MKLTFQTLPLRMRDAWTISRGSTTEKRNHLVKIEADGIVGYGEAAHNVRYDESAETGAHFLNAAANFLRGRSPWHFRQLEPQLRALAPGQHASKAAIDMALLDWAGKAAGQPLHRLFGVDASLAPVTSYSIGIDEPQRIRQKVQEAEPYPILKIKLGGPDDRGTMAAVRDVTDKPVRVDANEGWTDRSHALAQIEWLATCGVEFVEQPMPANRLEDVAWLRERSPLPLIADEDVKSATDLANLAESYDGVNIKVMKSAGLLEALRMTAIARRLNLKIMLGCMIESSLGITAAAQLSPLVDWADLDGNLLLRDDPFEGVRIFEGKLILPASAGIGAIPMETSS